MEIFNGIEELLKLPEVNALVRAFDKVKGHMMEPQSTACVSLGIIFEAAKQRKEGLIDQDTYLDKIKSPRSSIEQAFITTNCDGKYPPPANSDAVDESVEHDKNKVDLKENPNVTRLLDGFEVHSFDNIWFEMSVPLAASHQKLIDDAIASVKRFVQRKPFEPRVV